MMIVKLKYKVIFTFILIVICLGAKLNAQSDNNKVFEEVETFLNIAREQSADLLCPDDYLEAVNYYNAAKKNLSQEKNAREIRIQLEWAVSYITHANNKIEDRFKVFDPVLKACKEALIAGADKYSVFYWSSAEKKFAEAVSDFSDQDLVGVQKNIPSIILDYNKSKETAVYVSFLISNWGPLQNANNVLANLLSPENYSNALSKYHESLENLSEGEEITSVNKLINDAGNLFEKSTAISKNFRSRYSETLQARKDASIAGAEIHSVDLWKDAEATLYKAGLSFEKEKIDAAVKNALTAKEKYLAAKHLAVKTTFFSKSDSLVNLAKKEGAEENATRTLAESDSLINLGTEIIYSDQYDQDRLKGIVTLAEARAVLARDINQTVNNVEEGKTTWENLILDWNIHGYGKANYLQKQTEVLSLPVEKKAGELSTDLKKIQDATKNVFNSDEAEIFSNGDELTVRLIGIKYSWLGYMVSEETKKILDKTIHVLESSAFSNVSIASHNDYIAAKTFNLAISQERANKIREYILSKSNLPSSKITAIGYGETMPITNDKSFEGRKKNIRIELIIK